jgi:UDP-2-acetamido-3-amino-2,3-dideoxy-glucuronate N-acetyltransferase
MPITIHKTAEISSEAKIGQGTKIWHHSQVLAGAQIGENCTIGHDCLIADGARLGNGVKVQSNTDVWQGVILEDYVFVGPSAVFTNDPNPRAKYPKKDFPEYGRWQPTLVKEGATIGANATVICGAAIGKWAFVGAGAVVKGQVPDYALIVGVPARQIGWMCECANKLIFKNDRADCGICGRKYSKKGAQITQIK